jgi:hypothetical protein
MSNKKNREIDYADTGPGEVSFIDPKYDRRNKRRNRRKARNKFDSSLKYSKKHNEKEYEDDEFQYDEY